MDSFDYTIVGSSGFIGKNLKARLEDTGSGNIFCPARGENVSGKNLGTLYYCSGMTGDFRSDPKNLIHAHVSLLAELLESNEVRNVVYLSSSRVYGWGAPEQAPADEECPIEIYCNDLNYIYNCSKIFGELVLRSLGERHGIETCVLRLSNVVGYDPESPNSLWAHIRSVADKGMIRFLTTPDSSKDYVSIESVVSVLAELATHFHSGVYNLSFGENLSNAELAQGFEKLGVGEIVYSDDAKKIVGCTVKNEKLKETFQTVPTSGLETLGLLLKRYLREERNENRN